MLNSVAALGVSFHSVNVKLCRLRPSHIYSSSSSVFSLSYKQMHLLLLVTPLTIRI